MKDLFATASYKTVMKGKLLEERGQLSRAAEYLNCQRSYLSRVISEELQLTPDHAFQLTLFWKMTGDERDYFLALVEHERAVTPELRAFAHAKILDFRKRYASIQARTPNKVIEVGAEQVAYFSSWTWSAIHFLTSVPEFQTAEAIARRLALTTELVTSQLQRLAQRGLVEERRGKWIYLSGEFHAPKESPLVLLHHQNWRSRAILDAQSHENGSLHYTSVQTMSRIDAEKIKALLLEFISESNRIAGPSTPEEGVVVLCDFFKL